MSPASQGRRTSRHRSSLMRTACSSSDSAAAPHVSRSTRVSISERRFTVHAFHASVVKSWPFSCARNVSSSSAGWPATSWAAAVSAAARCAITSRFHQPAAALGSSHESGSANWIMRPSRWRSACAMPTRSSRLIVTCRVGLPAPFGADCTVAAMRVLVCPDKFRGTLTARQAGEAIERGWRRARPDDVIDVRPAGRRRRGHARRARAVRGRPGAARDRAGRRAARRSGRRRVRAAW